MSSLESARSLLFVPGDRPERFEKAINTGADCVIIDLEDAVTPENKIDARKHIELFLNRVDNKKILLRINDANSQFFSEDLKLAKHENLAGVVLPKANYHHILCLVSKVKSPVFPLIETVIGLRDLKDIVQIPNVARFLLGTIDLSLEMNLDISHKGGQAMLDQARFALVSTALLAGLAPPIDGVSPDLNDSTGLRTAALHSRATGMGGMMCIHPRQVEIVQDAFRLNESELEWAGLVVAAASTQKSSFQFQGKMIDKPIIDRALRILASAKSSVSIVENK